MSVGEKLDVEESFATNINDTTRSQVRVWIRTHEVRRSHTGVWCGKVNEINLFMKCRCGIIRCAALWCGNEHTKCVGVV